MVVLCVIADLSDCQLMQIPDAVYHLMRNTVLKTCDLSSNDISKIGANLAKKFSEITGKDEQFSNAHHLQDKKGI